jgi:hypothetical protein
VRLDYGSGYVLKKVNVVDGLRSEKEDYDCGTTVFSATKRRVAIGAFR